MATSFAVKAGFGVSVLLVVLAVLFFFQTADPMILAFAMLALLMMWVVIAVVHLMRHGIPVRLVGEQPKR